MGKEMEEIVNRIADGTIYEKRVALSQAVSAYRAILKSVVDSIVESSSDASKVLLAESLKEFACSYIDILEKARLASVASSVDRDIFAILLTQFRFDDAIGDVHELLDRPSEDLVIPALYSIQKVDAAMVGPLIVRRLKLKNSDSLVEGLLSFCSSSNIALPIKVLESAVESHATWGIKRMVDEGLIRTY